MLLKGVFDVIQKKYNKTIRYEVENFNKNILITILKSKELKDKVFLF